jgi:hypothetical protein
MLKIVPEILRAVVAVVPTYNRPSLLHLKHGDARLAISNRRVISLLVFTAKTEVKRT